MDTVCAIFQWYIFWRKPGDLILSKPALIFKIRTLWLFAITKSRIWFQHIIVCTLPRHCGPGVTLPDIKLYVELWNDIMTQLEEKRQWKKKKKEAASKNVWRSLDWMPQLPVAGPPANWEDLSTPIIQYLGYRHTADQLRTGRVRMGQDDSKSSLVFLAC